MRDEPSRGPARHLQAGAVAFIEGNVVLRRSRNGQWLFPKGHVEPGESLEETAARELQEETGVVATAGAYLLPVRYSWRGEEYEVHLFSMTVHELGASWADHDGIDAALVAPGEARRRLSFDDYRRALDVALATRT